MCSVDSEDGFHFNVFVSDFRVTASSCRFTQLSTKTGNERQDESSNLTDDMKQQTLFKLFNAAIWLHSL